MQKYSFYLLNLCMHTAIFRAKFSKLVTGKRVLSLNCYQPLNAAGSYVWDSLILTKDTGGG